MVVRVERDESTNDDFSKVSHMESMPIINQNHLEMHKTKIESIYKDNEVWKHRIVYLGFPHL